MKINFKHEINGEKLITAIAQDFKSNQILMVGNMNKEALIKTLKTGKAHYWSTSRNKQWLKGESSGNIQEVKEIFIDCDMNAIILKVKQHVAACHKGYPSCFYRKLKLENNINIENINDEDFEIILKRVFNPEDVY